jgi:hypothetical protein
LRRYVRSKVGQPWNKVYSEIAEHLRPTSVTHRHVLQHLEHMVVLDSMVERDGHLWRMSHRPIKLGRDQLYVCPRTGILKKARGCERSCCRGESTRRNVSTLSEYRRIHGCWYEVLYAPIPSPEKDRNAFDAVLGRYLHRAPLLRPTELEAAHQRTGAYALSRRKLTRAERIAAGLPRNG